MVSVFFFLTYAIFLAFMAIFVNSEYLTYSESFASFLFSICVSAWTVLPVFIYENVYRGSQKYFSRSGVWISNVISFLALPVATIILFILITYDVFLSTTETSSTAAIGLLFVPFWPLFFGSIPAAVNLYLVSQAKKESNLKQSDGLNIT